MLCDNVFTSDPRVLKTALSLQRNGYEVTVFCQRDEGLLEYEEIQGVKIKRVFRYKLGTTVLIDKYLQAHFQLREALDSEEKFDVFHCHDTETWPIGYIFAKEHQAKWVADSHEYFPDYIIRESYPNDNKYNMAKLLINNRGEYIRYADAVITVSNSTARKLTEEFSLRCPVTTIFNTLSPDYIIKEDKKMLRDYYGFQDTEKIIVFAGNLTRERGIDFVLSILYKLPKEFKLLVIGDGYFAPMLRDLQKKEKRIMFLGYIPYKELIKYVYAADIYMYFPSVKLTGNCKNFAYTIPNKFFDAIFSSIPFYTYNSLLFVDYINKFTLGKGFDLNVSAEDVAKFIVENNESYSFNGKFKEAQECFSWEKQQYKLLSLYRNLFSN